MASKTLKAIIQKWDHLQPNQHCSQESACGIRAWLNADGKYHRVDESGIQDGPAIIWSDGVQGWLFNGKYHRLDGPAVIFRDGECRWYLEGKLMAQEQWSRDPRVILYHSRTQQEAEEYLKSL